MKNILITGARSYVAYSLMKLAKLQNIKIFIGDSQEKTICFKSKFFYKKIIFPSPRYDFYNFKKFILEFCVKEKIDKIYPTCEEVFYFSMIKKQLQEKGIKVFCDDILILKNIHSKFEFSNLIKGYKIKIPKTYLVNSLTELEKYKNSKTNYIFKYEYSRFANNIFVNFDSKNFKNISRLDKLDGKLVVQEFIKGEKICSFGIAKKGELLSNICYKSKLDYKGGSSTFFVNIYNEKINNFVALFVKKINFNGFISFDYIILENEIFVIECNPRITSGIHLFDENKKLSNIIFTDFEDKFFPKKTEIRTFLLPNIFFNISKIFRYKDAFKFKNEVLKTEKKLFFYQLNLLLYYFFLSLKEGKELTEITTGDIEFNG